MDEPIETDKTWVIVEQGPGKPPGSQVPSITVLRGTGFEGVGDSEGPTFYSPSDVDDFIAELHAAVGHVFPGHDED